MLEAISDDTTGRTMDTLRSTSTISLPVLVYSLPLLLLFIASGCATTSDSQQLYELDKRIYQLEQRVRTLETRYEAPAVIPRRSLEELQKHLDALYRERKRLSLTRTDQHPDMRELDRKIHTLREQIEMLKQRGNN